MATLLDPRHDEFRDIVRSHEARLYRYAYRLCRDRFLAEDLVQDTLERAWRAWTSMRDRASVTPWLLIILRNESARHFARGRPWRATEDVASLEIPARDDGHALREALAIVADLPILWQEPLLLQVLGGLTSREIAQALGTTEGAVQTRLSRARRALRTRRIDVAGKARPPAPALVEAALRAPGSL